MLSEAEFNKFYLDKTLKRLIFERIKRLERKTGLLLSKEDLYQDIFLKVWQERKKYIAPETPDYGWFLTTAKITVSNHLQAEFARLKRDTRWSGITEYGWYEDEDEVKHLEPIDETTPEVTFSGERTQYETRSLNRSGVERLPKGLREVYSLRLEGYSYKEVAGKLGISESVARKRLERAKRRLTTKQP